MSNSKSAALHEDFGRVHAVRSASDRSFGLLFAGIFAAYTIFPLLHHRPVRWWTLVIALLLLAIALVRPRLLAPLNRAWGRLGIVLQLVIGKLVILLLFFVVITPIAVLKRRLGDDAMTLAWDRNAVSYWVHRSSAVQPMNSQF